MSIWWVNHKQTYALERIGGYIWSPKHQKGGKKAAENTIEQTILNDRELSETDKDALVKARRGQGQFRKNLKLVEQGCRLTGITDARLLIASHIRPWKLCVTSDQRLDGHNGLLLAPNADHLFDLGYMSFTDDGYVLLGDSLSSDDLRGLGLSTPSELNVGPFTDLQKGYLAFHRARNGFG